MNSRARQLSRQYAAALCRYLKRPQETHLQQAYELGREASARGLGVLDVARVHQSALASCLSPTQSAAEKARTLRAAETLFMETLSPFEAMHRGFRDANLELQQLNAQLKRRNAELRASEDHFHQLFEQARVMQENLRALSTKILHVQEEERKHISRELHDEVGQALTAIDVNLALLQRNGDAGPAGLRKRIADAQNLLRQTMNTVHDFACELRPSTLDDLGLLPALRSYTQRFAERTGLGVRFAAAADFEDLNSEQKTVVFRVTQESLTNVAKHAHARRVVVSLRRLADRLRLQIQDDGKSFLVDRQLCVNGKKRLGLLGMQERVRLVNGRFAIESAPGRGTTVRVEIPFKSDKEKLTYAKNKCAAG